MNDLKRNWPNQLKGDHIQARYKLKYKATYNLS